MVEKISRWILILLVLWIVFSWADVLLNNDPVDGSYNYSPINIMTVLGVK